MKFQPLGIENKNIQLTLPCRKCLVRPTCKTICEDFENFTNTYTDTPLSLYFFIIECIIFLFMIILIGFINWILAFISYIVMWVIMLTISIKYDDFSLNDLTDRRWWVSTFLLLFAPAAMLCIWTGIKFEAYVTKNSPFDLF